MRTLSEVRRDDIELVAINDLADARTLAHLYNYDTVHGRAKVRATAGDRRLDIDGHTVKTFAAKDPAELPWRELGVDIVLECTGVFTDRTKLQPHFDAGARKVVLSAPAKDHEAMIVIGVNEADYDPASHHIISCGSCTTNALAPVAKVLDETFGIQFALMTTIHAYTNDQPVLDIPHRKGDLRRARAAAMNMIPTSTGAAKAIGDVLPRLQGQDRRAGGARADDGRESCRSHRDDGATADEGCDRSSDATRQRRRIARHSRLLATNRSCPRTISATRARRSTTRR